jgi:hypothetical protein
MHLKNYEGGKIYPGTYVDNDHMGDWSMHVTGGTLVDSALPGGAQNLLTSTGEGDIAQIIGPLAFEVDVGVPIIFECDLNVSVDASTARAIFFGFTDQNAAGEIPIEDEDGTIGAQATDCVGLMMEVEQDATWQVMSVNAGTTGAQTALTGSTDSVVGVWQRLRVAIGASGDTTVGIGQYNTNNLFLGFSVLTAGETRSAAVSTSVVLAPTISLDGRAAAVTLQVRNPMFRGPGMEVTG